MFQSSTFLDFHLIRWFHLFRIVGRNYLYQFVSSHEKYLLVRGSVSKLKKYAERKRIKMELDTVEMETVFKGENSDFDFGNMEIVHDIDYSTILPLQHIFVPFTQKFQQLFWRHEGLTHPFSNEVRIEMLLGLLRDDVSVGGAGLCIRDLVASGLVVGIFPLQNYKLKAVLIDFWLYCVWPWRQPYLDIKDYFGEKIALHCAFVGHFSAWLVFPAICGIPFEVLGIVQKNWSR